MAFSVEGCFLKFSQHRGGSFLFMRAFFVVREVGGGDVPMLDTHTTGYFVHKKKRPLNFTSPKSMF